MRNKWLTSYSAQAKKETLLKQLTLVLEVSKPINKHMNILYNKFDTFCFTNILNMALSH